MRALVALALLVALPYAYAPVYRFPAPKPFSGSEYYNPYQSPVKTWQRANLHAHGRTWGGLTNGYQPDHHIVRQYRFLGYDVAGVSNYQHIAEPDRVDGLRIYEHGFNVVKAHQLAIAADSVTWLDYPLWQTLGQQQAVIHAIGRTADLVALAHPSSYSSDALVRLTDYQLMEVANGPHNYERQWDVVLSSGHRVWGLGNDDVHDISDPRRVAIAWTMINASSASRADLVDALREGRSYAVFRSNYGASTIDTTLEGIEFRDHTLFVRCAGDPSTFRFIGQNGRVRKTVLDAMQADYRFERGDTYIRAVVHTPRTTIFLNPIVRVGSDREATRGARVSPAGTLAVRSVATLAIVVAGLVYRKRRRARDPE